MKKLGVIGGGITGCITALHAAKKGYEVTLFEKDKILGGILKDTKLNEDIFFNSCQYFNPEEPWYKKYIQNQFNFKIFDHEKGSYTNIFDNEVFSSQVPNPTYDKKINLSEVFKKKKFNKKESLSERLNCYPEFVSKSIKKWIEGHEVDSNYLSWDHPNGFACGRVFFDKHIDEIKILKKEVPFLDEILCLPDKYRDTDLSISKVSVPKNGFNDFFENLKIYLEKNNVKLNMAAVIKPIWEKNNLLISCHGKKYLFDKIFWSGNPTGLIKSYGLPLLDSLHISSRNLHFNLRGKLKNNFYLQIFSKDHPISRVYFYNLNQKPKLTVETFLKDFRDINIVNFCKTIIKKFNLDLAFFNDNSDVEEIQKKYVVVSSRDKKIISDFILKTKNSNLIPGCWLIYARDMKIQHVLNNI